MVLVDFLVQKIAVSVHIIMLFVVDLQLEVDVLYLVL